MAATPEHPRVFVSHASEDKQRFVVEFARRLRENGVDAWLDQWEMGPGDSLVDKIFEQGLKNAQAVIVVVSAASVQKPWVREELNLSVVKKITQGMKLIPVVIDQCEVPEALKSTIWQRIDDLDHYDAAFQRILGAIFDRSEKPALGEPPRRFVAAEPKIAALTATDERVLCEVARHELELEEGVVTTDQLFAEPALAGVAEEELRESVDILRQRDLLMVDTATPQTLFLRLSTEGFRQYA
ncbi:MAG TPA: toll/interleukin-1 receptor domain-containing protein, partial [Povalibacter sp.]|nr:toll/interleukin-1 receptor domain-containing protein [Povalibacter sp.]